MKKILFLIAAVVVTVTGMVKAQTMNEVINLFNDAAEKTNKGDYQTAIIDFEQLLPIAEQVGDSATDLAGKAKEQLPILYWQVAAGHLKQRKFDEAIPALEKTVELATEFNNNATTMERAARMLPQVYTAVGTQKFREKNYADAISTFSKAVKVDNSYSKAYLGIGLAYAEMEDEKNMIENLEKAIELAKAEKDEKTVETAVFKLTKYYTDLGDLELENVDPVDKDFTYAIEFYTQALEYDPASSDANYKLALIFNQKFEYDKAIEHCNKALESETVDVKIAAIQLELGNAYFNIAQYPQACEAYNKAMVGPIEEMALKRKEKVPGCN
jgi:tetratricopeptide (TPR) repeat protein